MINISSAACSQLWNLRGYQNTVSAACATGTIAIGDAYEIIKNGKAKMMLAGAGESLRSDFSQWSIDVLGALSKEKTNIQKQVVLLVRIEVGLSFQKGLLLSVLKS